MLLVAGLFLFVVGLFTGALNLMTLVGPGRPVELNTLLARKIKAVGWLCGLLSVAGGGLVIEELIVGVL